MGRLGVFLGICLIAMGIFGGWSLEHSSDGAEAEPPRLFMR